MAVMVMLQTYFVYLIQYLNAKDINCINIMIQCYINNQQIENVASLYNKHIELNNDICNVLPTKNIDVKESDDNKNANAFYKIQDMKYDYGLSIIAHLRHCQMFEFEALYGTIGCYLFGGFLPGPCGFYRSKYLLKFEVRGWYLDKINQKNDVNNMDLV
eukprot:108815_1